MFWPVRLGSIAAALAVCFLLNLIAGGLDDYAHRLLILAGLYVTLAVSLNLINGITGQFSLGHGAFYQIGAYMTGFITVRFFANSPVQGIPWLLGMMVLGAIFASIAGLLVGLPSLRLRGDYLAIVTLGFGEIIRIVVQNIDAVGGPYGFNVQPRFQALWLVWLLAFVCIAVTRNLLKTAHGLPFLAVREDEIASSAMGVNVTRVKVTAFVIGSGFAGAAGALLAHFEGFITPQTFGMYISFIILTMVVLGGTGSITGSALAAVFLSYLPEYLRNVRGPGGEPLALTGAAVVGGLLAAAFAVAAIRKLMDTGWKTPLIRAGAYAGIIVVAALVGPRLLALPLLQVPALSEPNIGADQLRMVIFASTLIILMLLRPQGVLAHHEFSWDVLRRLFRRPPAASEGANP